MRRRYHTPQAPKGDAKNVREKGQSISQTTMEASSYPLLLISQNCDRWTTVLVQVFESQIHEYLANTYELARGWAETQRKGKETDFILALFQKWCLDISEWSVKELRARVEAVRQEYDDLEHLISTTLRCNLIVMSVTRTSPDANQIQMNKIPPSVFVHRCFIECGKMASKCGYLFDKSVPGVERLKNHGEATRMIRDTIHRTILSFLPLQNLGSRNSPVHSRRRSPSPNRFASPEVYTNKRVSVKTPTKTRQTPPVPNYPNPKPHAFTPPKTPTTHPGPQEARRSTPRPAEPVRRTSTSKTPQQPEFVVEDEDVGPEDSASQILLRSSFTRVSKGETKPDDVSTPSRVSAGSDTKCSSTKGDQPTDCPPLVLEPTSEDGSEGDGGSQEDLDLDVVEQEVARLSVE